ncbi:MAG: PH domain-containing protein [Heliobacteriaceae bacterium]|jgi:hypothetical protein|nr:PH domain-containing protein [Heliobacteriaceae bacterium]
MYCSNCGEKVEDYDKFCRCCGETLAFKEAPKHHIVISKPAQIIEEIHNNDDEEIVLYTGKKHIMGLMWPIIMSPFFVTLFWHVYVATNTMFGTIFGILLIVQVVVPVLRFCCDGLVITNKFVHLQYGIIDTEEVDIPIKKADSVITGRTFLGKIFGYCYVSFPAGNKDKALLHMKDYRQLRAIFEDPEAFVFDATGELPDTPSPEKEMQLV